MLFTNTFEVSDHHRSFSYYTITSRSINDDNTSTPASSSSANMHYVKLLHQISQLCYSQSVPCTLSLPDQKLHLFFMFQRSPSPSLLMDQINQLIKSQQQQQENQNEKSFINNIETVEQKSIDLSSDLSPTVHTTLMASLKNYFHYLLLQQEQKWENGRGNEDSSAGVSNYPYSLRSHPQFCNIGDFIFNRQQLHENNNHNHNNNNNNENSNHVMMNGHSYSTDDNSDDSEAMSSRNQFLSVTGFRLTFFVHNESSIRFHVFVEKRKLKPLREKWSSMDQQSKRNLLVYTPLSGLPGRISWNDANSDDSISNHAASVVVGAYSDAFLVPVEHLFEIPSMETVNDSLDRLIRETRDQLPQPYHDDISKPGSVLGYDELTADQSFAELMSPPPMTPFPITPALNGTPSNLELHPLPPQQTPILYSNPTDTLITYEPEHEQLDVDNYSEVSYVPHSTVMLNDEEYVQPIESILKGKTVEMMYHIPARFLQDYPTVVNNDANTVSEESTSSELKKEVILPSQDTQSTDNEPHVQKSDAGVNNKKFESEAEDELSDSGMETLTMGDMELENLLHEFDADSDQELDLRDIPQTSVEQNVAKAQSPEQQISKTEETKTLSRAELMAMSIPPTTISVDDIQQLETGVQSLKRQRLSRRIRALGQLTQFSIDVNNVVYEPFEEDEPMDQSSTYFVQKTTREDLLSIEHEKEKSKILPYFACKEYQVESEVDVIAPRDTSFLPQRIQREKYDPSQEQSLITSYIYNMRKQIQKICKKRTARFGDYERNYKRLKQEHYDSDSSSDSDSDSDSESSADDEPMIQNNKVATALFPYMNTAAAIALYEELNMYGHESGISNLIDMFRTTVLDSTHMIDVPLSKFIADSVWIDTSNNKLRSLTMEQTTSDLIQTASRSNHSFLSDDGISTSAQDITSVLFDLHQSSDNLHTHINGPLNPDLVSQKDIFDLNIPNIRVGYTEQWLDASPEIVQFWEKALLEPYSQSKVVHYCVVSVDDQFGSTFDLLNDFFHNLTATYDSCKLGSHIPISSNSLNCGIATYQLDDSLLREDNTNMFMNHFTSKFTETLVHTFNAMASIADTLPRDEFIVVYIINPFSMIHSLISTFSSSKAVAFTSSRLFCDLLQVVSQAIAKSDMNQLVRCNITFQFLDMEEVISAYEIRPLSLFKKIAQSTYDRLRRARRWPIARKGSDYSLMLYEPLVVLSPPPPCLSSGCLPDKGIERHQHTFLHCAYTTLDHIVSINHSSPHESDLYLSICASWSDCTGHLMESDIFVYQGSVETAKIEKATEDAFNTIFRDIHQRSLMYMTSLHNLEQKMEGGQSYWNYVICRYDDMRGGSDSFRSIELGLWKSICDHTSTNDLAILGSMSIVSVNNSNLQVLIDNMIESQLQDIKSNPDYSNSFIVIDGDKETQQVDDATKLKPKAKGYVVSSLNNNPYLLKERQVMQTSVLTNFSEQDYRTLEVRLFDFRQLACNFPIHGAHTTPFTDFLQKLCKQYHDLSWLTISSTRPFRETNLPAHLRLLQNMKQNFTYFNRHTTYV